MRTQSFYRGGRLYGTPIYGRGVDTIIMGQGVNTFLINEPEQSFYGIDENSAPPSESRVNAFLYRSDMDADVGNNIHVAPKFVGSQTHNVRKVSGAGNGLDNVIKKLGKLKVGNSRTSNIAFDF